MTHNPQSPERPEEKPAEEPVVGHFEVMPVQSTVEAVAPHFSRNEVQNPALSRVLLGLGFLAISLLGASGLAVAFIPNWNLRSPMMQAAAVEAAQHDFFADTSIEAKSAYVYDVRDDKKLFSKNDSAQMPLASITKVALVLAINEVLASNATITISHSAVEKGGGKLTWGEEWRVRDLIDYTLITSSNTGAEALRETADPLLSARYAEAPKANATVWRMNTLAQEIGMHETYFLNASGLDESRSQAGALSSARDVAALFAFALRTQRALFEGTAKSDVLLGPSNAPERDAHNTNESLVSVDGILMGKTGSTDLAGGNLAIAFDAAVDHPIIVVVLGSSILGRFDDVQKLSEAARKYVISSE